MAQEDAIRPDAYGPMSKDAANLPFWSGLAPHLGRMRFQLLIGVLFAIVAPAVIRPNVEFHVDPLIQYDNSFLGTLGAFLLGFVVFRKVTAFPGVRASGYILPAFAASYVAVFLVFAVFRLDYSRYQLIVSFLAAVGAFYMIFFVARRGRRLQLALVPGGDVTRLMQLRMVDWYVLSAPDSSGAGAPLVADLRADLDPAWERFIADSALDGRPVYNAKSVFESLSGRVQIEHLSENTFGTLLPNSIYDSAKRHTDFLLAAVALLMLLPFLVAVALLIKLESSGPSIFRQQRMGFRGRPFTVYKFRTMREARTAPSESSTAHLMTADNDPRITRLGRLLRRTRIDELPQLINVLKGEMSWIGPRPEAMALSELYESQIPFYRYRHAVRPGITGWAQVNQGHVTVVADADLKLQYDFYYVKNFSLWLDLLVVLRTVRVVFTGQGAK